MRPFLIAAAASASVVLVGACGSDPTPTPEPPDTSTYYRPPHSCVYECPNSACPEAARPYACPALEPWARIPHEAECGAWDGTYPKVVQGKCTATAPTGEAMRYAGPDGTGATVLPDGRRIKPAGADWVFAEPDVKGGLTANVLRIPGTTLVATVDDGYGDHAVRIVEATAIGGGDPVKGLVKFAAPSTLNSEIAFQAPDHLFVGTNDGVVQALTVDKVTGALARDDSKSIKLPDAKNGSGKVIPWYVSGVAIAPDGKRLLVSSATERALLVFDSDPASSAYGKQLGSVDLGDNETFAIAFDPADAAGTTAYVTMWNRKQVLEVAIGDGTAPTVARSFATEKAPESMAFLDARWMVVSGDLGDALTVVDRVAGTTTRVPVDAAAKQNGSEPTALAWDAARKRLYATLAGMNAVRAWDVDLGPNPPTFSPAGMLGTGFWPSGIATLDDGSLVVSNLRGRGTGPRPLYSDLGDSDIGDRMRGSIQRAPFPTGPDLAAGETAVRANASPATLPGVPTVTCDGGAKDFPVPLTNAEGPSSQIKHVILVVRENKGFDGVFGDFPNVEGDPTMTLKPSKTDMEVLWKNFRTLARTFTMSDDYYTDAIYSTQGHVWATYGRANDFDERTWAVSGAGRNARAVPGGGIVEVGRPQEGSLFDWLDQNGVYYDLLGEIVGTPSKPSPDHPPSDIKYPGGPFQNIGYPDNEKACYGAAKARVFCNFVDFAYMTITNDHTFGVSPNRATPETMVATNDEATGMLIDGISHSPMWASTLVLVTEDDPSQGGEHVDSHRTPLVAISPWVKRGYVSKTHIDMASLHKILAHVLGKPYLNASVASAALPFDMFTSTPDYTPYVYTPRTWPLACGDGSQKDEVDLGSAWDFSREDQQPGLDAQVERWMRGAPPITPEAKARVLDRIARGAR